MPELIYPIKIEGYIDSWGRWEVVRELVTNAMDASENWSITRREGKFSDILVVRDEGNGLGVKDLLLGHTGHERGDGKHGRFGEGLKMALVVLTRFGVRADLKSGEFHAWNEPTEMFDETVMKLVWTNGHTFKGTTVEVPWPKEEPIYEDRFLVDGDPRVAYMDENTGRAILRMEHPAFFHKGVYVREASYYSQGCAFGYNLVSSPIDRDRNMVDGWQALSEAAKMWGTCQDVELLELFWQAVDAESAERNVYLSRPGNAELLQQSFRAHYGRFAVVKTNDDMEREAEHRGATAVNIGRTLTDVLKDTLETDEDYVCELEGQSKVPIKDRELPEDKLSLLRKLRRLTKKIGFAGKIGAFVLQGHEAESSKGDIRLDIKALVDERDALKAIIHELAHIKHGTNDRTPQHEEAILEIACDLILGGK